MGLAARASVPLRRNPWVCALLGRRPRSRRAAASPAPDRVPPGGRRPREGPAGRGGAAAKPEEHQVRGEAAGHRDAGALRSLPGNRGAAAQRRAVQEHEAVQDISGARVREPGHLQWRRRNRPAAPTESMRHRCPARRWSWTGRGGRASGRSSRRGPRAWTAWPCARRARIRLGHAGRGMAARASGLIEAAGSTTGDPVTFLIYSPFPKYSGGRENWLHNLAPHLKESGRPVRVIAYATDRAPFHAVEQSGIRVAALPSVRYFYDAFRLVNRLTLGLLKYLDIFFFYPMVAAIYLAATRPRNLVCMNPIPEGMVALLAGVPYVVSVRGEVSKGLSHPFTFLERPLAWLERQVLRRARKVLANGRDTQQRLAGSGIASTVVPNGVDFRRFAEPAPPGELGIALEQKAHG